MFKKPKEIRKQIREMQREETKLLHKLLGENVQTRREELGLSLTDLAYKIKMKRSTLDKLEKGELLRVSNLTIICLMKALGMTFAEIWKGADKIIMRKQQ